MQIKEEVAAAQQDSQNIFHWPRHSYIIEQIRCKPVKLNEEVEIKLRNLDLYQEQGASQYTDGRLLDAARKCGRSIRRRVWMRFDIFMERDRPGLRLQEGRVAEEREKKKMKKRTRRGKKNTKDDNEIENSFLSLIKSEDKHHLARAL